MKFKALINGVHIDPKKGTVKISLAVASHISLDELTTIGPRDENIHVTFESVESEQTKLEPYPEEYAKRKEEEELREQERIAAGGVAIEPGSQEEREGDTTTLGEEEAVKLKEAAERLEE